MTKTTKKQKAAPVDPGGRPALQKGVESVIVPIRMTPEQKEKFHRIGGAVRMREWLDRAKEYEDAEE